MRALSTIVWAVMLSGCVTMGERQAHRYFVLEPRATASTDAQAVPVQAAPTTAAAFYDTQDIVFSRAPGTRGYYQFNHWTERPQRVIESGLVARFAPRRDGYVLATHVLEMYHDAREAPGSSRVTVAAELIDPVRRSVVSRRTFSRSARAASHDAAGAVEAFDQAVGEVIDDIVQWAAVEAASASAR